MRYQFPHINHINDVLPAIKDSPEFIVAEREHYDVVNYVVAHPETFPEVKTVGLTNGTITHEGIFESEAAHYAAIRRECRGLIFDKQGNLIARRLHKFFNVNERDETQQHLIDLSQPHVILEKLDGSMITPIPIENHFRYATKMGITDVSMGAETFVATRKHYINFARVMFAMGFTPIFEWCSRKQRIVVDYPEDRLVLIAIRNTVTGEYASYDVMLECGRSYSIDVVKAYTGSVESMTHLIDETRDLKGVEGWVIRFDDGHMVKIKAEEYLRFHKTKDSLSQEKNVIDLIISENVDDAKAFMMPEDRKRVEEFEYKFWHNVEAMARMFEAYHSTNVAHGIDRKTWALEHMKSMNESNPFASSIVFNLYNGKTALDTIKDLIAKNLSTQTRVDEARCLWGGLRWNYTFGEEQEKTASGFFGHWAERNYVENIN
jgi:RNA ligase